MQTVRRNKPASAWSRGFFVGPFPQELRRVIVIRSMFNKPGGAKEAAPMGSGHPKIFDPIAIERMRASFHEILDALEEQYERPLSVGEDRLKAAIISRLLTLAADGTPQQDWKSKVLSTLPLQ